MRLGAAGGPQNDAKFGYFRAETVDQLEAVVAKLDLYGLSAIASPVRTPEMDEDECIEFGEKAASFGLVISEVHFLTNLVAPTPELRQERVELARSLLRKADLMGARCLLGFAGSAHPDNEIGAQCAYNFTDDFRAEVRELVLRVLDGVELKHTKYGLEANNKTFFYGPEGCLELIDTVDHPDFGLHLDMMNMISQATYYKTTDVINTTFELLGDKIWAAHLKDIRWDRHYQFLRLDEVIVGDGEMDYPTLIGHLANYDVDFPCMCEHLETEQDYVVSFERLSKLASDAGTQWVGRGVPSAA